VAYSIAGTLCSTFDKLFYQIAISCILICIFSQSCSCKTSAMIVIHTEEIRKIVRIVFKLRIIRTNIISEYNINSLCFRSLLCAACIFLLRPRERWRSIVMSTFCLSVCLSVCPRGYLRKLYSQNVPLSKCPVVETSQSHNVPSQNVPSQIVPILR